ncbi:hypothetical protein LCGC14_1682790 [marine sediment metagenome]|uniref:Uncharacterized protein n=1 Tax=marine sediment metagenome TaxID=412755 RepID=A0A0F9HNK9_9ZZZZ
MSESKTVCHHCKRKPGERHKRKCALGRRYRIPDSLRAKTAPPRGYPVANIYDCLAGPIKTVAIPRGTSSTIGDLK